MSLSFPSYESMIKDAIKVFNNDVEPQYLPNLKEIRDGSNYCLDILHAKRSSLFNLGGVKSNKGLSTVFESALNTLTENIKTKQRWSFWHYTLICAITSLAYAEMITKGENQSIALNEQKTWDSPDEKVAILFFNFVAGQLYPKALPEIIKINGLDTIFTRNESTTDRYRFFCSFLLKKINEVTT